MSYLNVLFTAELCSFGQATGLARASHCIATVATCASPLRLHKSVAENLLMNFESIRLGTEHFFHSMIWAWATLTRSGYAPLASACPSQLHILEKVAVFSRVPSD